jgi:hypothetical protein
VSAGHVHFKASLLLAAGFSVGALVSQEPKMLECVVGAVVGILISPDLDLSNGGIVGGKLIRKRVGWIGERVWKRFWRGYSSSFKHGTWASHAPLFSTFIRLSYAYYWAVFIPHILIYFLVSPLWSLTYVLSWYAKIFFSPMFLYGLISSDVIHFFLDKLTTESK